jgi:hypothetical protein
MVICEKLTGQQCHGTILTQQNQNEMFEVKLIIDDSVGRVLDLLIETGTERMLSELAMKAECGRAISEAIHANQWEELGHLARTEPAAKRPKALELSRFVLLS